MRHPAQVRYGYCVSGAGGPYKNTGAYSASANHCALLVLKGGSATMEAPRKATLDASMEHPALTPLTRRLAGELWEIVRAKAEAEGLPVEEARLQGNTDVEGVDEAYIAVLCAAPSMSARPSSSRGRRLRRMA